MLQLILIALFLSPIAYGLQGGTPAPHGEFPAHVAIRVGNEYCGGVIVNDNHVVTAAQCLLNAENNFVNPTQVWVVAGVVELIASLPAIPVAAIFPHPQFNPHSFENDIAVIRLTTNFTFDTEVAMPPIDQALINDRIVADETVCRVAGWNPPSAMNPVSRLNFLTLPILNRHNPCNARHEGKIRDSMICAGDLTTGADRVCWSTRGGGLYCNRVLTGIVSFGFSCGVTEVTPGVYTQVRMYRNWIIDQFSQSDIPEDATTTLTPIETTTPSSTSTIASSACLLLFTAILLRF